MYNFTNILKSEIQVSGYITLTAYGNSMLPIIENGQKVQVIKPNSFKIGDIIAYTLDSQDIQHIIIHRVVFVRETYLLTKGDNNDFIDRIKVPIEKIIGQILL